LVVEAVLCGSVLVVVVVVLVGERMGDVVVCGVVDVVEAGSGMLVEAGTAKAGESMLHPLNFCESSQL
jgi:hypothetical protein